MTMVYGDNFTSRRKMKVYSNGTLITRMKAAVFLVWFPFTISLVFIDSKLTH